MRFHFSGSCLQTDKYLLQKCPWTFWPVLKSLKVENHFSGSGSNIETSNAVQTQLWTPQGSSESITDRRQCHSIPLLSHSSFIRCSFLNLKLSSMFFHALQDVCCYISAILVLYLSQCNWIHSFLSKIIFCIWITAWQLKHETVLGNVLYAYSNEHYITKYFLNIFTIMAPKTVCTVILLLLTGNA